MHPDEKPGCYDSWPDKRVQGAYFRVVRSHPTAIECYRAAVNGKIQFVPFSKGQTVYVKVIAATAHVEIVDIDQDKCGRIQTSHQVIKFACVNGQITPIPKPTDIAFCLDHKDGKAPKTHRIKDPQGGLF
jgi:hypothetical protein